MSPPTPAERSIGVREAVALAALLLVTAATLHLMGQPWWCERGDLRPWISEVQSAHNSQHLADPYTLTHVLHGLGFYLIVWALLRGRFEQRDRFLVAMAAEAVWEVWENTDFVISRYRDSTISLDYYGDSVVNALGDIVATAAGYGLAMALPLWGSVAVFAGIEVLLMVWIRDSLFLNILMLIWPIESIKTWQMST